MAVPAHSHYHAVQFYGTERELFRTVGGFLSEGLAARQPSILIASEAHHAGILEELNCPLTDIENARQRGDLTMLDAHELLQMVLTGGMPNEVLFEEHCGTLFEQILAGREGTTIRLYGEMVDVLCKDGRVEAAVALETLANTLPVFRNCEILCGYSSGPFYSRPQQMQQVCALHTHVVASDSKILPFDRGRQRKS